MHCCFPCVADFFLSQVEKYVSLIPVHEFYHFQSPFSFRFDCPYSFRVLVLSSFSFRVNIFAVIYIYIYICFSKYFWMLCGHFTILISLHNQWFCSNNFQFWPCIRNPDCPQVCAVILRYNHLMEDSQHFKLCWLL